MAVDKDLLYILELYFEVVKIRYLEIDILTLGIWVINFGKLLMKSMLLGILEDMKCKDIIDIFIEHVVSTISYPQLTSKVGEGSVSVSFEESAETVKGTLQKSEISDFTGTVTKEPNLIDISD